MPVHLSTPCRSNLLRLAAVAGAICLCWHPSLAEKVELTQAQRTLLELQLKDAYKCELSEILFSRELEIGGQKSLEGRIRCKDQREVDFTQASPNQKFQLRLCQPTVC